MVGFEGLSAPASENDALVREQSEKPFILAEDRWAGLSEFSKQACIRKLGAVLRSTMEQLPDGVRDVLHEHFAGRPHIFIGVPFTHNERYATAWYNTKSRAIEITLPLLFAPSDVSASVFVHELGHAYLRASGWCCGDPAIAESFEHKDDYRGREDQWAEEIEVDRLVAE